MRFNGYRALTMLAARPDSRAPRRAWRRSRWSTPAIAATDLGADVVGPEALATDSEWSYLISFLPGLKSAGGTEQILRNTIGERVLGLPPEPRLDKGIPFSELRAKEKEALAVMNFALSDEQEFLREAARGALSRHKTIEAAREALEDPSALPDLWPTAVEAGLARAADRRGARRRRARRVRRDAGGRGVRPGARVGAAAGARARRRRSSNAAGDESLDAVADGRAAAGVPPGAAAERARGRLDGRARVGLRARRGAASATVDGDEVALDGTVVVRP